MKRDHDEEFDQDQGINQEGLNEVENVNQENHDSNDMMNPSEDSGSNQQTEMLQLLDPNSQDGNPAKRQKRSDDEEIRLLIPSKVSSR